MINYSKLIDARQESLNKWIKILRLTEDADLSKLIIGNNNNSIECEWQKKARANGFKHVNLFCSLSAWGDHITDMLTDTRFDQLNYSFLFGDAKKISRYYIRFFLISSEYIADFVDIYRKIYGQKKVTDKNAREKLTKADGLDLNKFMQYVNTFLKHKMDNFHKCNHHLLYTYSDNINTDMEDNIKSDKTVDITSSKITEITQYIHLPKLAEIIEALEYCYQTIDRIFEDKEIFIRVCRDFETMKD